jgi:hypothetical protein
MLRKPSVGCLDIPWRVSGDALPHRALSKQGKSVTPVCTVAKGKHSFGSFGEALGLGQSPTSDKDAPVNLPKPPIQAFLFPDASLGCFLSVMECYAMLLISKYTLNNVKSSASQSNSL